MGIRMENAIKSVHGRQLLIQSILGSKGTQKQTKIQFVFAVSRMEETRRKDHMHKIVELFLKDKAKFAVRVPDQWRKAIIAHPEDVERMVEAKKLILYELTQDPVLMETADSFFFL